MFLKQLFLFITIISFSISFGMQDDQDVDEMSQMLQRALRVAQKNGISFTQMKKNLEGVRNELHKRSFPEKIEPLVITTNSWITTTSSAENVKKVDLVKRYVLTCNNCGSSYRSNKIMQTHIQYCPDLRYRKIELKINNIKDSIVLI